MLIYRRTSLLESTAQTLVNTVNCVGVMGKGIAKDFKEREPEMFAAYKRVCDQKQLAPGKLWLWRGADSWTLNFPTKKHWRNPSKIEWIESGLRKFVDTYQSLGITEISFPRLGCGNGGLDWEEVRPLMERYLQSLTIPVYIHDYTVDIDLPEHMENIARQLKTEISNEASFELFLSAINRVVELTGKGLFEIDTKKSMAASIVEDGVLKLELEQTAWSFEREDLWGAWIGLQKGLLTKDKAGWSREGAGTPLLSFLSVLPHVRPVQIQGVRSEPEVALEYRPGERGNVIVPSPKTQLEMAWH